MIFLFLLLGLFKFLDGIFQELEICFKSLYQCFHTERSKGIDVSVQNVVAREIKES